jgi:uncharacterized protein YcgI (DUF1989 family)
MAEYSHDIPGGSVWSTPVRAGRLVALTALGEGANLSVLLVGSDRLDRLNIPDTLKAQMSACIRPSMVLMSDRGLALASVVASSLDWHDALTGFAHDQCSTDMSGIGTSGIGTSGIGTSGTGIGGSGLILELAKHGLGEADLHGCVNFFSKVEVDEQGGLRFLPGYARAGDTVTLRTEQDLLLIAAATSHPMADTTVRDLAGVRVDVSFAPWPTASDEPEGFRPESARALEQTRRAFA